jgi:hypothetical protein
MMQSFTEQSDFKLTCIKCYQLFAVILVNISTSLNSYLAMTSYQMPKNMIHVMFGCFTISVLSTGLALCVLLDSTTKLETTGIYIGGSTKNVMKSRAAIFLLIVSVIILWSVSLYMIVQ